ncbi:Protein of unknown function (DUF1230) [Seminavis robusta]|uniref:Uncharacterized protein n=1 Tax=Seminavis robusta TaxID=568900 RepID=A0A9N8HQV7_9STRA|nr:Protein of unknown function (DUF1230) [Seminavis robusta]|eukprot:Sro1330_g263410.1 Protein of unknown function (DUF1230) (234) ;mRNA; f:16056-17314
MAQEDEFAPRPETSFGADGVPEGQRPVNEFLDVTSQPMFGWASLETGSKGLLTRLVTVYSVLFFTVCYPIAGATFTQDGYLLQKITAANVGDLFVALMILLRIFSGWSYVGSRLNSNVIEYEETGWYDGDFETKSPSEKLRDELLYEEKVEPVVDRLKLFTISAAGLWVASCIGYNVALSAKPLFNEYDPAMLERLRADDKLADVAAQQSGGKPTYCDNRYYRAVANGGQGCN